MKVEGLEFELVPSGDTNTSGEGVKLCNSSAPVFYPVWRWRVCVRNNRVSQSSAALGPVSDGRSLYGWRGGGIRSRSWAGDGRLWRRRWQKVAR